MKGRRWGLRPVAVALTAVAAIGVAASSVAQAFPSKPVRVINPTAPGGNSDILFRLLQPKMSEVLGQNLVMDYRSGAGGIIGIERSTENFKVARHRNQACPAPQSRSAENRDQL